MLWRKLMSLKKAQAMMFYSSNPGFLNSSTTDVLMPDNSLLWEALLCSVARVSSASQAPAHQCQRRLLLPSHDDRKCLQTAAP